MTLDRKNAPWDYRKGEPFRVIAALELLGSLLGAKIFLPKAEGLHWAAGKISAGATTDNLGNRFVLNRLMSTKFPLLAFLCEFAVLLEERGCLFELGWVPRDQNEQADAITNGNYSDFKMANEIRIVLEEMDFRVLGDLLDLGDKFYEEVETERREARASRRLLPAGAQGPAAGRNAKRKARKGAGLKATDPW